MNIGLHSQVMLLGINQIDTNDVGLMPAEPENLIIALDGSEENILVTGTCNRWVQISIATEQGGSSDLSAFINVDDSGIISGTIPLGNLTTNPVTLEVVVSDLDNDSCSPTAVSNTLEISNYYAILPDPCDGALDVDHTVPAFALSWLNGIDADSHDVYLGTDLTSVIDANTTFDPNNVYKGNYSTNSYTTGTLSYSRDYYWRIDEVNDSNLWTGVIWSFSTNSRPR